LGFRIRSVHVFIALILIILTALPLSVGVVIHLGVQSSGSVSSTNSIGFSKRGEVYVPDNALTISEALSIVAPGGVIYIRSGVYREDVRVEMPVKIVGLGDAVIDGSIVVASTRSVIIANITIAVYPPGSPSVIIYNSTDVELVNISVFYSGIVVSSSRNISIISSTFSYINSPAIIVELGSSNVTVEYCTFNSTYTALTVFSSSWIVFRYNYVYNTRSPYAVKLFSESSNVYVYMNNFFNVSKGYDDGFNNTWYNPLTGLGNYWEHIVRSCSCNPKSGVCEAVLEIDGAAGSRDVHPLCRPFEDYIARAANTSTNSLVEAPKTLIYAAIAAVAVALTVLLVIGGRMRWRKQPTPSF